MLGLQCTPGVQSSLRIYYLTFFPYVPVACAPLYKKMSQTLMFTICMCDEDLDVRALKRQIWAYFSRACHLAGLELGDWQL